MKRSRQSFPLIARARCECGCGWSGIDDVAQFCLEDALFLLIERRERLESHDALAGGELITAGVADDEGMQHARDFAARRA